ncbi:Rcs stress response system protein RcsF [Ferrimonas marina]|uniref:RcsF protein n=1 Tax=Ferrimonas marina TaxID=299255 RepID=A0A1M5VNG5_9GAMM|nr:Rcs stress response system protein RcsF [Ferrimonas marina]SHH76801.1 RcsF protein [Ferrimonas marina]
MRILIPLSLLWLAGCSSDYSFSSNLDPKNFETYFAPGQVQLVEHIPSNAERLGLVEGYSCQASSRDPIPQTADARTELRKAAAELGANAVRIQHCAELEPNTDGCLASIACYGEAAVLSQ